MKNIKIEKDPELENLIAKCKKKGLKFGLALGSGSAPGNGSYRSHSNP